MKKFAVALGTGIALTCLALPAFANKPAGAPVETTEQIVLPSLNDPLLQGCSDGSFFKDQFINLTDGNSAGEVARNYTVNGAEGPVDVTVTINWYRDNSFDFSVDNGVMRQLQVKTGYTLLYDYVSGEVKSDAGLNVRTDRAQDISHLRFCLGETPPDVTSPSLKITAPEPGAQVSGEVTVTAEVSDNVGLKSVIATATGGTVVEETQPSPNQYQWTWDTTGLTGSNTLTIKATDTSDNVATATVTIEIVVTLTGCLEGIDAIPIGSDGSGGCINSGVRLEYPEALRDQPGLPELLVTQASIPAIPGPNGNQTRQCGLAADGTVLYPDIAQDPRVDVNGNIVDVRPLDLRELFDIDAYFAAVFPNRPVPQDVILGDTIYGAICLSLYHQDAPDFANLQQFLPPDFFLGFSLSTFLLDPAGNPRPVSVMTQGPEDLAGMYAGSDRITAPLNFCELGTDPGCQLLPACLNDANAQCYQPSQQFIERAISQPDDIRLLIQPFAFDGTSEVYNRSRTIGFKGTFGILNGRRVCPALEMVDSPFVPGTADYLQAELDCMVAQTVAVFFDAETAIKESDARGNLLSPNVTRLLNPHSKALGQIRNQHFERALDYLNDLLDQIYRGSWTIDENNDPGRLIMMVSALIFQVEQHLATEQCLEDAACLATYESQP